MRDFKGMKRQRGRNRKPGGNNANSANPNRSWDSQGPENIKVRGNAQTVYERYMQLARDAASAGDRVLAENYMQHAEHYFRVLRALQPQRPVSEIAQRELSSQGFDIDFEDESGAQAAAFLAAQQAAQQNGSGQNSGQTGQNTGQAGQQNNQGGDRDGSDGETRADRGDRNEGEGGGNRRESRRERWERRKDEQRSRRSSQDGEGESSDTASEDGQTAESAERDEDRSETSGRPARRPRRSRDEAASDEPPASDALPGFLTRPTARPVETAAPEEGSEAPAPRRRAPRRKPEPATADDGE